MNDTASKIKPFPSTWLIVLACACLLFLFAEFTYEKHPHVRYEEWFGICGFASLGGTIAMALVSLLLRPLLWREQEYYDG